MLAPNSFQQFLFQEKQHVWNSEGWKIPNLVETWANTSFWLLQASGRPHQRQFGMKFSEAPLCLELSLVANALCCYPKPRYRRNIPLDTNQPSVKSMPWPSLRKWGHPLWKYFGTSTLWSGHIFHKFEGWSYPPTKLSIKYEHEAKYWSNSIPSLGMNTSHQKHPSHTLTSRMRDSWMSWSFGTSQFLLSK